MLHTKGVLFFVLCVVAGCGTVSEQIDPIINEKSNVDVLSQFKPVQRDYIIAFCNIDAPLVHAVPFERDLEDPGAPVVTSFMCVPHEGPNAIDILCIDDHCSVGESKIPIQEFESGADEIVKRALAEEYMESI